MPTVGIKNLRKVQLGLEGSSAGVAQAATNVLIGEGTLKDTRETVFQKGDVGQFLGNTNTRVSKLGGELAFESEATFEQLPYTLNAAIDLATSTADGLGSGYIYQYLMATTTPTTPTTYTLEGGDNISSDVDVMVYGYVPEFTLSGTGGEPLMLSSTWKGRSVDLAAGLAFTSDIAVPTCESILFSRGKMWIDTSSDSIGTTTADNTLMAFELKVNTGLQEVWTADGLADPTFSFLKMTAPEATIDITFEHDATAAAQKAAWRAQTAQRIRLTFTGSSLTTTGTVYDNKTLIIDAYGKWIDIGAIDEQDGNDIVKGTLAVRYDSAGSSLSLDIIVVNELSALT